MTKTALKCNFKAIENTKLKRFRESRHSTLWGLTAYSQMFVGSFCNVGLLLSCFCGIVDLRYARGITDFRGLYQKGQRQVEVPPRAVMTYI